MYIEGDWDEPLKELKSYWDYLTDWEQDLVEHCLEALEAGDELTNDQQKSIVEIYYERVVEKISGRDR
jgi:hypothetical protein